MNVNFQSVNYRADIKLVEFTKKRIEKISQFYDQIVDVFVYTKVENTSDKISENEVKNAIQFLLIILILIGLYLVSYGGIVILLIGLSSFLFAYLYTATKFSIAYNGLGEIFVFTYFGIVASLGTFYLQTLTYNYSVFLLGTIFGCI